MPYATSSAACNASQFYHWDVSSWTINTNITGTFGAATLRGVNIVGGETPSTQPMTNWTEIFP